MWEVFQLLFISIIIPQLGYAYSSEESPASKTVGQATIGKAVSLDEFPYQVSLHTSFNGDEFFCGGIAVSNSTVLTPGQCLYYDWGGQMPHLVVIVHTGISSLNDKPLSKYEVSEITYHPKFNKMHIGNNLALLKISTQSQSDNSSIVLDYVLLAESFSQSSNSTENCTIVGWNKETRDLRSMDVNIVNCNSSSSNAMCIQKVDAESAMCNMSLGSSLICDDKLVGILTMQSYCNSSLPYTIVENIIPEKDWLLTNGAISYNSNLISIGFYFFAFLLITKKLLVD